jgi:hypothetical protein
LQWKRQKKCYDKKEKENRQAPMANKHCYKKKFNEIFFEGREDEDKRRQKTG